MLFKTTCFVLSMLMYFLLAIAETISDLCSGLQSFLQSAQGPTDRRLSCVAVYPVRGAE